MKTVFEFKECPDCKVDARVMNIIIQEEVAKGNMSKDVVPCISVSLYSVIDPRRPPLIGARIPGARVLRDICTRCGREVTTKIEVGRVTVPLKPGDPIQFT